MRVIDETARRRYRDHLVGVEAVSAPEADAFLDVLARGLAERSADAAALRAALDERVGVAAAFGVAAGAVSRHVADEATGRASRALLESLAAASPNRASPARVRALQDAAERQARAAGQS